MVEKTVRTRFAPSPTGPLHIGGLRNAVFGWLYARHHGGQAILRIEDTDRARFVEGSLEGIVRAFEWLGIDFDESPLTGGDYAPYKQSERLELYHEWSDWLLAHGKAYKSFETPEELEAISKARQAQKLPPGYDNRGREVSDEQIADYEAEGRPYVVRFKMPLEGKTIAQDLIRGSIEFDNTLNQDPVIIKGDGFPTYHFAHVVDDYLMAISHITRGNEWIPSLPIHWNLWEAFGWEKPIYAHLPLILNPNGKGKMSKRYEAFEEGGQRILVLAEEYIEAGYLPEALFNFLSNIGWNYGDDVEIFNIPQAIERFDLADVNPSNSAFPIDKLDWLNGHYIRELAPDVLAEKLAPILDKAGLMANRSRLLDVAKVSQTRIKTLNEFVTLAGFFFCDDDTYEAPSAEMLIPKKMDAEMTKAMLEASIKLLEEIDGFDHEGLYEAFKGLAQALGVKNGQLFGALRVALTSQTVSTPTFETMAILGRAESVRRIGVSLASLTQG